MRKYNPAVSRQFDRGYIAGATFVSETTPGTVLCKTYANPNGTKRYFKKFSEAAAAAREFADYLHETELLKNNDLSAWIEV